MKKIWMLLFLLMLSLIVGIAIASNEKNIKPYILHEVVPVCKSVIKSEAPVIKSQVVGFNRIECFRGKPMLVTSAFKNINGMPLKSQDVFGSQLPEGTKVFTHSGASYSDYICDRYTSIGWDDNITYSSGMSFWIDIDGLASNDSYDVVLFGEVPMDDVASNVVYEAYNMMGYPFVTSILWTNTALSKEIESQGGIIFTYDLDNGYMENRYTSIGWENPDMVIQASMGFWIYNENMAYTNLELRPYDP
jgi:hypothetical protein